MATGALAETVAEDLEQVASVTRRLDGRALGYLWVGLGVGTAVGFYFGYKYSKSKLRNEIYAEAEKDIETIREHYQKKLIAADNTDKPAVEEIIRDKGYASEVDHTEEPVHLEYARLDDPTDPPEPQSIRSNIFAAQNNRSPMTRMSTTQKDKDDDWNWEVEMRERKNLTDFEPYILYQDEYGTQESGFSQASYIYYVKDDVLVDEDDPKTILSNQENLIGSKALQNFGHGADDYNTVYVRNPNLELEFEIHRVVGSWEEEVLGLDSNESG